MKPLSISFVLCLIVAPASACPNLAGHYMLRGEDGVVDYTVRQKACDRVEIDRTATYLGKTSAVGTQVFIPDGKSHGKRATISRWVGDKLQIGQVADHVYYGIDSSGNLHMSDGRSYPQCNGPCDEVAEKVKLAPELHIPKTGAGSRVAFREPVMRADRNFQLGLLDCPRNQTIHMINGTTLTMKRAPKLPSYVAIM